MFKDLKIMKTNIITINTIMKNLVKYFCAILLLIGTSASAWALTGVNCTYKVWDAVRNKWQPYVVQDQALVVPPAPERANYVFVGWHIESNSANWYTTGQGNYKWDDDANPIENRTYFIHPIPNKADNDDNKHTAMHGPYTEMFAVYRPSSVSNPSTGWTTNSGWTAPSETQITITFKPNGGTPNSDQTQQILANTPTHLSSCPFMYSSHEFAGWGTKTSIGTLTYADCQEVTFAADQTLYAEWVEADKYSIQYRLTGMTKIEGPTEVDEGDDIDAFFAFSSGYAAPVTCTVEMQKYFFTYEDITEDSYYENGELLVGPAGGITGNVIITITATEKTKFTVTYLANGATSGSGPSNHTNVTKNSSITVRDKGTMEKTGYTFSGWNKKADGSGTNVAVGSSLTVTSDLYLYAKWVPNQNKLAVADADNVTITATPSGGSAITEGNEADVDYGKSVTLAYSSVVSPHEWRSWKVTKTDDGTDVTTSVLEGSTLTMPDYDVTVSCKLTGDYIAWCPDPTIMLSGDIAVSAYYNRGVMAVTPLHVEAVNLDNTATVTLRSNSSDIYFSADRNANFLKSAPYLPTTTLDLTASDGIIDTDVYVHYRPGSAGDGSASSVTITATWDTPEPDLTDELDINVRSLPEKFVIATKVGANWYALPANMTGECTPDAVIIDVDETDYTATASNTCSYTMWPVKTHETAANDRYALNGGNAYGERVRLVRAATGDDRKGLWANNSKSSNSIKLANVIAGLKADGAAPNEWKIETTVGATGNEWKYTLQTDQANNQNYLNLYRTMQWGTYGSGLTDGVYFLPVTEVEPFKMKVVEWYPTKVLVYTTATLSSPSVKIGGEAVASPTCTGKGTNLYEIGNLALEGNPTKTLSITNSGSTAITTIPVIISRVTKNLVNPSGDEIGGYKPLNEPFASLTKEVYNHADLVVRDGAHLTLNGTQAQNEFYDITIYPTSKISVPETNANGDANKLSVHSLTFFGGIDEIYNGSSYSTNKYGVPELALQGTVAKKSVATINYDMRVDLNQMYSLTVPYNVELADITYWDGTSMTPGSDLYVSAYDGQARADMDKENAWVYETDFESKFGSAMLQAGVGYTISAEPEYEFGNTYAIIRMPMKNNVSTTAPTNTETEKFVPVTAFVNAKGQTISDNHKGWNFVGNPYMVTISGSTAGGASDTKLAVGKLMPDESSGKWNGKYYWDTEDEEYNYRYVTIPQDDGLDYNQEKWSEVTLPPFKNFFIQVKTSGDLYFALESRQNMPALYARVLEREIEFDILLNNDGRQDHTGLLIADQYSPAYEINADLEKMDKTMAVYTLTGGYKLAYNALSPDDASQPIPVGYVANTSGSYTFSLKEGGVLGDIAHIWLTDYDLNRVVDLMETSYDFTTDKGRNETRFALTVELKKEDDPISTSAEALETDNEVPIKFIYQDKMYILNRGVIYDAVGKKVREINN